MKRKSVFVSFLTMIFFCTSCSLKENRISAPSGNRTSMTDSSNVKEDVNLKIGTETYRGFVVDNVLSSDSGDIHFHLYLPKNYDGKKQYALYISLCGYGGYYFQGIGINLRQENFVFEAMRYNDEMIIAAPQLNDWGNTSAEQTIELTEYLISHYPINPDKVYMNGYSGGGETLSLVMGKRPSLYSRALHVSSIWDGSLSPLVESEVPVYFAIGENDEYYGSSRIKETYSKLRELYKEKGLSEERIESLLVLDVKPRSYFDERGVSNQHGGGGLFAYDETIMSWLFS